MKAYKPNPLAAGFAFAILWGVSVLFMGIFGNFRGQYEMFVNLMGEFYIGYSISIGGIIIGFLRAILDAFCGAFLLVRLYNVIFKALPKKRK
ncbi:hypothetical protein K9M48_03450 [Candidatus Gracilibacteria bacterium]|nr:hypothetical protein [Candidatus Gracilibacteria bacterium]